MDIKSSIYDQKFLEYSWKWLNDEDIKKLTDTPDFTQRDQQLWFSSLPKKKGYKIWGITADNMPIGAFGIKNITEQRGEYWGYIGDKLFWSKGIGNWMMETIEKEALKINLSVLYLHVNDINYRAMNLYFKHGFKIKSRIEPHQYLMEKKLSS